MARSKTKGSFVIVELLPILLGGEYATHGDGLGRGVGHLYPDRPLPWHRGDDTHTFALEAHGYIVLHGLDTRDLDPRVGDDLVEGDGRAYGSLGRCDTHLEASQRVDDLLLVALDLLHIYLRSALLIVSEEVCRGLLVVCQEYPRSERGNRLGSILYELVSGG